MADRTLTLRIIWTQPVPAQHEGHPTDFGMQKGRDVLLPGVLQLDGSTVYETEVTPYIDKAGRQRFRGECMQGPPNEPFLYLSYRYKGVPTGWIGRGKAMLELTSEFLETLPEKAVLELKMTRLGGRDRTAQWQVVS